MTPLEALILGLIQGLTEFLPISSSGHLELAKALLGSKVVPEEGLFFTVLVHGATALATMLVFRKEIGALLKGTFSKGHGDEKKFTLFILVSMVPAALVGLLFEDAIEQLFSSNIPLVGSMLILTGVLLFFSDKAGNTSGELSLQKALWIGIAQAIAILPGISRSGATISASLILGIERSKATRFSFLMVVPLILGKMAKDLLDSDLTIQAGSVLPLSIGFGAAFISGVWACTWMIKLIRKSKLSPFALYCWVMGASALLSSLMFV